MVYLRRKITELKKSDFDLISVYLQGGKVVVLPTDTIYGLSCLATDQKAIRKIYRIKKRDGRKPLITLASSLKMVKEFAYVPKDIESKLANLWSKSARPTTVILRAKDNVNPQLLNIDGGVSIRLPKSDFLTKIIRSLKCPIVSTSLNLSGESLIENLENLDLIFKGKNAPDLVIDTGPSRTKKPSRLIDFQEGKIKILRK